MIPVLEGLAHLSQPDPCCRVAAVTEGGLPAVLEKERQRLQEQQAARGERPEQ